MRYCIVLFDVVHASTAFKLYFVPIAVNYDFIPPVPNLFLFCLLQNKVTEFGIDKNNMFAFWDVSTSGQRNKRSIMFISTPE